VLNPAISETKVSRRSRGEDAIYFAAAKNRYVGSVSLGYGPDGKRIRRKVLGKTKQEVRARLKALHQEMNSGVRSSSTYTVRQTVEDWLCEGLDGTSERTRALYQGLLEPVVEMIGARPLRDLSAGVVLFLGPLGPQHVVEEQLADVPRGQPGRFQAGTVHDDLAELAGF
jgi:hypothetical protein